MREITIWIARRKDPGAIAVDRSSALGNPSHLDDESQRDQVCEDYHAFLFHTVVPIINSMDQHLPKFEDFRRMRAQLENIAIEARLHGQVKLGCWCDPKRCHAQSIAELIKHWLEHDGYGVNIRYTRR